jgi:AcrR family transcriptional regulator
VRVEKGIDLINRLIKMSESMPITASGKLTMTTKPNSSVLPKGGDSCDARGKLIKAGLKMYSEVGYEGASTRKLAAAAGVNIATIPYYFGNKEGLYLAVIDHIVECYRNNLGGSLERIRIELKNRAITSDEGYALLDDFIRKFVCFVLQEGSECSQISKIYIREQLDPTSGFVRIYTGFIKELRETLADLVETILGRCVKQVEIKLIVETMLGQVAIFKSSRVTVLQNLGWQNYGAERIADIERIVTFNVRALIRAYQEKDSGNEN